MRAWESERKPPGSGLKPRVRERAQAPGGGAGGTTVRLGGSAAVLNGALQGQQRGQRGVGAGPGAACLPNPPALPAAHLAEVAARSTLRPTVPPECPPACSDACTACSSQRKNR